ncbi:MAG TPA: SIS domain-containing protein [Thermoanaerobaculia bacterium]|nr:SIS domain-containing protein [Thermoanaerobaculia bacterium]
MPEAFDFDPRVFVEERLRTRNEVSAAFFAREAEPLAETSRRMAGRFRRGGRLIAFGRGPYATDAQHVSVEFVHPVIVGKSALPAIDLSLAFGDRLPAILRAEDMVMGFSPPAGDDEIAAALDLARGRGALTFELPARDAAAVAGAGYAAPAASEEAFVHQEIVEILYHTLWETVHVFFEHRELGHDVGESAFLYPFLGSAEQDTSSVVAEVAASIRSKAAEVERLRSEVARDQTAALVAAAAALRERVARGGTLLLFGNGGSATDANDWAIDCAQAEGERGPIPAVSLAMEPANLSAIANDVGTDAVFLRQLIALARPEDVAIGISTSGGSSNVVEALVEARRRGLATLALLGYDGGEIVRRGLVDHALVVRSDYVPRIQEVQASIYHVILELLAAAGDRELARAGDGERQARPAPGDATATHTSTRLELYGDTSCPFSRDLREDLLWRGERFVEHDVDVDAGALRRLIELSGGEPRVPTLVEDGRVREVGWRGRSCTISSGGISPGGNSPGEISSGGSSASGGVCDRR